MFIKEEITQYQYQTYKEEITNKLARIQVKNVLKIVIKDNGNGIIKLSDNMVVSIKI